MAKPIQVLTFFLANPIDATQTSIQVRGLKDSRGNSIIAMPSGVTIIYATIEPRSNTNQESISFTGITDNGNGLVTLTGCTRNLNPQPPYTALSPDVPHGNNVECVISNSAPFYNTFLQTDQDATITGDWNFTQVPSTSGGDPIADNDLARKSWVLSIVNGGAVSTDKIIEAGTAGETITIGQPVYLKVSDGRWYRAIGTTAATVQGVQLGIAQGSTTVGNLIPAGVLRRGIDNNQSGGTAALAYISNTSTIDDAAGTVERVVGVWLDADSVIFDPSFYYELTAEQKLALSGGGDLGTPSGTNKFLTELIATAAGINQSQTTQDGSVEVGEANTTLKKNKLAQSFTPTKKKIRSVNLYKLADTGSFTGTVKVALQADTGGSPSGSDLASITLSNIEWRSLPVGSFEAVFSSQYTSLTPASLYWIVVTPSTSDNSNHPNLGTNTAGGYSGGSVKYNNVTDGWLAIATIDLYFKINEGTTDQLIKTNPSGKMESTFYDRSEMPFPSYPQLIDITGGINPQPTDTGENYLYCGASNLDGSVIVLYCYGSTSRLQRFVRNSLTGVYTLTHVIAPSSFDTKATLTIIGDYVYQINDGGTNMAGRRWNLADLTGEVALTLPVIALAGTNNVDCWTDGVYLYALAGNSNTVYQFSISGTTLTTASTGSADTNIYNYVGNNSYMFDGKTMYAFRNDSSGIVISKFADVFGASVTTTAFIYNNFPFGNSTNARAVGVNIDSQLLYLVKSLMNSATNTGTTVKNLLLFTPFQKP